MLMSDFDRRNHQIHQQYEAYLAQRKSRLAALAQNIEDCMTEYIPACCYLEAMHSDRQDMEGWLRLVEVLLARASRLPSTAD
jgi:hypothetical protein